MSCAGGSKPSIGLTLPSRLLGDIQDDGIEFDFFGTSDTQSDSEMRNVLNKDSGEKSSTASDSGGGNHVDGQGAPEKVENGIGIKTSSDNITNIDSPKLETDGLNDGTTNINDTNKNSNSNGRSYTSNDSGRQKAVPPRKNTSGNGNRRQHNSAQFMKEISSDIDGDRPWSPTDLTDSALVQALRHPRDRNLALSIEADLYEYVAGAMHANAMLSNTAIQQYEPLYYPYLSNKFHRLLVYRICDRFSLSRLHQDGDADNPPSIKINLLRRTNMPRNLLLNYVTMFPDYFKFEEAPVAGSPTGYEGASSKDGNVATSTDGGKINRIMQRPTPSSASRSESASSKGRGNNASGDTKKPEEEVNEERLLAYEKKKLAIFGDESVATATNTADLSVEQQSADSSNVHSDGPSTIDGTSSGNEETIPGDKSIRMNRDQEQADPDFQAGRAAGRHGMSRGAGGRGGRGGYVNPVRNRNGRGRGRGDDMMGMMMQRGYDMHMYGAADVMMHPYMGNPLMYQMMTQHYNAMPPPYAIPMPHQATLMQPTMQFAMDATGMMMPPMMPGHTGSTSPVMGMPVAVGAGIEMHYPVAPTVDANIEAGQGPYMQGKHQE